MFCKPTSACGLVHVYNAKAIAQCQSKNGPERETTKGTMGHEFLSRKSKEKEESQLLEKLVGMVYCTGIFSFCSNCVLT